LRGLAGEHPWRFGISLKAEEGHPVGFAVPLEPVKAGDFMRVDIAEWAAPA